MRAFSDLPHLAYPRVDHLRFFVLVCGLLADRCPSLRSVSKELERLDMSNELPEWAHTSFACISLLPDRFERLLTHSFGHRIEVFAVPRPGFPTRLTPDGLAALRLAEEFVEIVDAEARETDAQALQITLTR